MIDWRQERPLPLRRRRSIAQMLRVVGFSAAAGFDPGFPCPLAGGYSLPDVVTAGRFK